VKWSTFLRGRETWSGRTRAIAQGYYRGLLKNAVEIEALEHVHACRRIKGYNSRVKPPGEALTAGEVARLLDAADTPMHRALFGYAFGQGLRPAEVTALCWDDVDWEGGVVLIRGTKNETAEKRVPLTPASRAELMPYWKSLGSPLSGVAFMWRAKPLKSWRKAFRRSVERANLNPDGTRRIIPYSARYTFATLGVVAGISDAAMRQAMRHSSRSRVLETTYQRLQLGQVKAELAAFPVFREVPEQRAQGGQLEKGSATD
jgi:integrase